MRTVLGIIIIAVVVIVIFLLSLFCKCLESFSDVLKVTYQVNIKGRIQI